MILKEEMKARSGSYDNDPWASARNSRSGSKETLSGLGYSNTVNGSPRSPYSADTDPFISKSASLPGYGRNSINRPHSTDYFHYDSTNAVNWGFREYKIYPYQDLIVTVRGRNQLPGDVDRTRLETPVPGRVLPGVRYDDGRFRALGTMEAERAKEAGEAVLRNRPLTRVPQGRQTDSSGGGK